MKSMPPSVNYHLIQQCNMKCGYCYATFNDVVRDVLPRGHLGRDRALELVARIAPSFRKITFAGGEPTLCPYWLDLVREAKSRGLVTMLVTNGSRLSPALFDALDGQLDWLTLSIDSASEATHAALGRSLSGKAMSRARYAEIARRARGAGMRLKVNTVVTSANQAEDLSSLLVELAPERWKVLRALPIEGQNDGRIEPLLVSAEAFARFVARHAALRAAGVAIVPEDHDDIQGSYAMIDPAGRFFDDMEGRHRYSAPILDVGVEEAWSMVHFDPHRFLLRGGSYAF